MSAALWLVVVALAIRLPGWLAELGFDEVNRWRSGDLAWRELWGGSARLLGGNVLFALLVKGLRGAFGSEVLLKVLLGGVSLGAGLLMWSELKRRGWARRADAVLAITMLAPFQVMLSTQLREYALVQALAIVGWVWMERRGGDRIAGPAGLAALGAISTLVYLPSVTFWIVLALHRWRGERARARELLAPMPAAVAAALTVASWPEAYRGGLQAFESHLINDPFKLAADLVFYVQTWVWVPEGSAADGLHRFRLAGGIDGYWVYRAGSTVVPFILGGLVLGLAILGVRGLGAVALELVLLGAGPIALTFVAGWLATGRPALHFAAAHAPSAPFLYALVAQGLAGTGKPARAAMVCPMVVVSAITLGLYSMGLHPETCHGLPEVLAQIERSTPLGAPVLVSPGLVLPFVRHQAPVGLAQRMIPVGLDAMEDPDGWASLYRPLGAGEVDAAVARFSTAGRGVLLEVPWAARRKDPERRLSRAVGGGDASTTQPHRCLEVTRWVRPEPRAGHCRRVREAIRSGVAFLRDRYGRLGVPNTTVWDVRDASRTISVMGLYDPAWIYLALEGVADGGELADLRQGLLRFMSQQVEASQLVRFHGADSSTYAALRYGDLPRPFEFRGHPPDIGTTGLVLLALESGGQGSFEKAAETIRTNTQPGGGALATWIPEGGPMTGHDTTTPDVAMNANALEFLAHRGQTSPEACAMISRTLARNSLEASVYYPSPELVGYFIHRALRAGASCPADILQERLEASLLPMVRESHTGGVNDSALLLVASASDTFDLDSLARAVVDAQQSDGSWPIEAVYRTAVEYELPESVRWLLFDLPLERGWVGVLRKMPLPLLRYGSAELSTTLAIEGLTAHERSVCAQDPPNE